MIREKYFKSLDNAEQFARENPILCHYTDFNALYGILHNGELWLRSPFIMNDKLECKEFINLIIERLKEDIPQEFEAIEKVKTEIEKNFDLEILSIASFSKARDDISQWERYADRARGVCIEFDTKELIKIFRYVSLYLSDIHYKCEVDVKYYSEILKNYIKNKELGNYISINYLYDEIALCSTLVKNVGYIAEQEVRLFKDYIGGEGYSSEYLAFRSCIQKIDKLNLKKLCNINGVNFGKLFKSIIIGPLSIQEPSELCNFLRSEGLDELAENVKVTKCTIRR